VSRPVVVILGPHRDAVSGVSTHLNLLMGSTLAGDFELVHFQVGSEGRDEGPAGRMLRLLASPFALFATILFRHASLVHINTSLNPRAYWRDLAYLAVAKLLRARVLYQVHGGKSPEKFFAGRPALARFLHWTLTCPDLVVVLAQCELDAYRRFVPGQDVVSLPNGIDCRPYASIATVDAQSGRALRLVFVGRIAREKGLYESLQGLRLAHERGVNASLTIAGGGAEEERLKRYAAALGIASRVTFAGPVFGADKVKLLASADVMLLPSYSEGLPYALLESMAAGIPVIATPVGAIPDVMTDGIHGHIVPLRDGRAIAEALVALDADREKLSWMSRACRRRIRAAYAIERLAAELAIVYERLACGLAPAATAHAASAARRRSPARRETAPLSGRRD
jgi:glycosyltransferase involved in cell wall biosynthesis